MIQKQTSIAELPEGWEVVRLSDTAEIRGNKSINGFDKVAFIPMEAVPDAGISVDFEVRPMKDVKSFTYCESGDILLAKITPSLENGKQGIVPDNVPNGFALATTEVFPISCKNIERLFLFYVLKFPKFRNKIIASMTGTTGRQRATKVSVKNLRIPLPPLPEQKKIAEILSTVDNAIQKVDEAIQKTERLKKGLMQELLTKGIGHERFRDSPVGRIPEEWEVVRLGDVGKLQYGYTASATEKNTGIKFIRITDIQNNGFVDWENVPFCDIVESDYAKFKLNQGDILFARIGATTGKSAYIDIPVNGVFASYLIRLESSEGIETKFLFYYTQSRPYWTQVNKSKGGQLKKGLNAKMLGKIKIPIPPLPEQKKIAEILSTVDRKLELERQRKERLERIKKGLMNDLLTGKRRVKVEA
jgi:type I restriction enzyme S subunit